MKIYEYKNGKTGVRTSADYYKKSKAKYHVLLDLHRFFLSVSMSFILTVAVAGLSIVYVLEGKLDVLTALSLDAGTFFLSFLLVYRLWTRYKKDI